MCLGVPGKVIDVDGDTEGVMRMGRVDFGGIVKNVSLAYVPEVIPGDYVIVHVGFAITVLDEESALLTLQTFRDLGLLDNELGVASTGSAA